MNEPISVIILNESNISLIISVISLIISICTFVYEFSVNKKNLKINLSEKHFNFYKDAEVFCLSINCNIANKSRNPINISSIKLDFENQSLSAVPVPIGLKGDGFTLYGQIIKYETSSISLPIRLESYDNLETSIVFVYFADDLSNFSNKRTKITFNTSRGKVTKKIFLSYQMWYIAQITDIIDNIKLIHGKSISGWNKSYKNSTNPYHKLDKNTSILIFILSSIINLIFWFSPFNIDN